MSSNLNRRKFLKVTAATGLALTVASSDVLGANDKLVVGVMGTGGRGTALAKSFAEQQGAEVAYVCDVDKKRVEAAAGVVMKTAGKEPKIVTDFRKILDDRAVDVLVVATCNHWHAPAAILGCSAGKHVYVEKPCSHNPREGELMVEAARKNKRAVQMGNQRRSWPAVIDLVKQIREGLIGRAYFAQAWYLNNRGTIGKGEEKPVPEGLDYELWQGPAPRKPFRNNYLHYNWHWFWHWGNGELGNNGVHMIDLCRWGLGVDYPIHVTSGGGRFHFQDDQETPDTHVVTYTFEDRKSITWQGLSCVRFPDGSVPHVMFHGDKGIVALTDKDYTVCDLKGKELKKEVVKGVDATHIGNFLDGCRGGKLNSEIEEAYKSTLLCHLGNIAQRTGRSLTCEPKHGHILHDKDAQTMWTREYAKGWEPTV